jgi:hypothetical protein
MSSRSWHQLVILILDRLRAHEAASVKDGVAEHKGRIELVYLPRRAPEYNPDEYLNNDLKGSVNQDGLPNSSEALRARIEAFMRRLPHWRDHVISYFHHPCVQYAAY